MHRAEPSISKDARLRRAEQRAHHAEAYFEALLNAAVDAIIVIDHRGGIETFNAAAERLFGYAASEVVGHNVRLLMPEPYRSEHDGYLHDYQVTGKAKIIGIGRETTAQRQDGSIFPIELAVGEVRLDGDLRFVGIVRDITERKRAYDLLRQQEEELFLTLQNAPLATASCDLGGRFLSANRALCDMLGYDEAELLRMSIGDVTPPNDRERNLKLVQRVVEGELDTYTLEKRCIRKDGGVVQGVLHCGVVHDAQGQPAWLVAQFEDRTAQLQAEEEARQHRERLAHVTRLSTMGEMAAGIAHEINQPLTAIATYAQACRRRLTVGTADSVKVLDLLAKIDKQAQRASEVIRRVRAMVKKRESQREQTDVNALITDVINTAQADPRILNCRVHTLLTPALPAVAVDPIQIQQVILNLIRNGMDAMETLVATERRLTISTALSDAERVEVTVSDQGIGFPDEAADELFKPFVTTKESGMGMGLAISRSIIDAHGGKLWFTPNQDRGTTFHLTLPVATEERHGRA